MRPTGGLLRRISSTRHVASRPKILGERPHHAVRRLTIAYHSPKRPGARIWNHVPPLIRPGWLQRPALKRTFLTESLPTVLIPLVVFLGLLISLWTYKSIMTVISQDKITYMPYMPPYARPEKTADYAVVCKPVEWREERLRSIDGTRISLCVGSVAHQQDVGSERQTVICYFQGNGSSLPPRLPLLSRVLKLINDSGSSKVRHKLVALSHRGYWTSSGRATQSGILLDAQAMLRWVARHHPSNAQLILWGQSVGAGIASTAAAHHIIDNNEPHIMGLIMETPFTGIKSMLLALYPQKWQPYRYLHPFLWNFWDSKAALQKIAGAAKGRDGHSNFCILLLPATRDELVPPAELEKVEQICESLGLAYERKNVSAPCTRRPQHEERVKRQTRRLYAKQRKVLRESRHSRCKVDITVP